MPRLITCDRRDDAAPANGVPENSNQSISNSLIPLTAEVTKASGRWHVQSFEQRTHDGGTM